MIFDLSKNTRKLAEKAAHLGAERIRDAIAARGQASVILATGVSQFETMEALTKAPDIEWQKVTAFHLDEYVGLPQTHKASFRRYLKERFVAKVPGLKSFVFIEGDADDLEAEVARVSDAISQVDIDVAFIGIGENGHLAFNDPPADFETTDPFIVVELDEPCRLQQLNEGWFSDLSEVPTRAISMSVRQILLSRVLVCAVADARKAEAVRRAMQGPVSNLCPASILQTHAQAHVFADPAAASLLDKKWLASASAPAP
ncbi:Glucosamine-6-phosphate deaminase [hydrothermal vent metagenome]|uniref:Glucosamine-6-phosphate deaminase n=1 Tax=hydrothermal vent metagenome TaxID=652676 RepID=A0A3B0TCI4_9ZZZZ